MTSQQDHARHVYHKFVFFTKSNNYECKFQADAICFSCESLSLLPSPDNSPGKKNRNKRTRIFCNKKFYLLNFVLDTFFLEYDRLISPHSPLLPRLFFRLNHFVCPKFFITKKTFKAIIMIIIIMTDNYFRIKRKKRFFCSCFIFFFSPSTAFFFLLFLLQMFHAAFFFLLCIISKSRPRHYYISWLVVVVVVTFRTDFCLILFFFVFRFVHYCLFVFFFFFSSDVFVSFISFLFFFSFYLLSLVGDFVKRSISLSRVQSRSGRVEMKLFVTIPFVVGFV